MDESDTAEAQVSNDERLLIRSVGRALWRSDLAPNTSLDDRKASWSEGQAKFRQQARKLIRALEGEGVTLSASADESTDDD